MPLSTFTSLPPEVILRIFQHTDDFATLNALVRTSSIFHCLWLLNANSTALAVLPKAVLCYAEAQWLVQAQELKEPTARTPEGQGRSYRGEIIVLVRRYLTNARLVYSFYESNVQPVLADLTAKGVDTDKWPLLERIFHHVCHFCDSQQRGIDPDLSVVLGTIGCSVEPDMGWIKDFYDDKPRKPAAPDAQPKIGLPPILEVNEIEATTLVSERPVKACSREQRRVPITLGIEVAGQPVPPQLQWTPKARRKEELLDYMRGAALEIPSSDEEQSYIMSAKGQKKHKL
ncbi:MAG: hypothetical protein Q9171_002543 [Xanthocarpia ochracea]